MSNLFEDALTNEFRWPTLNDEPFLPNIVNSNADSSLNSDSYFRTEAIIDGYKLAIDLIVKGAPRDGWRHSALAYPLVFMCRHYIELSIKRFLAEFGHRVGINANWSSHDLRLLWIQFEKMLAEYDIIDESEGHSAVSQIVVQFAKVDPGSYSYRYPVNTSGQPLPAALVEIDIENLGDVMDGVSSYFDGTDGYLSELISAAGY